MCVDRDLKGGEAHQVKMFRNRWRSQSDRRFQMRIARTSHSVFHKVCVPLLSIHSTQAYGKVRKTDPKVALSPHFQKSTVKNINSK
jgi:hypothetical protein